MQLDCIYISNLITQTKETGFLEQLKKPKGLAITLVSNLDRLEVHFIKLFKRTFKGGLSNGFLPATLLQEIFQHLKSISKRKAWKTLEKGYNNIYFNFSEDRYIGREGFHYFLVWKKKKKPNRSERIKPRFLLQMHRLLGEWLGKI